MGKRKTVDVQFVQETMEASSRLDARRRNYGDADEIEGETATQTIICVFARANS